MHVLVINAGSATLKYKLVRVVGEALGEAHGELGARRRFTVGEARAQLVEMRSHRSAS